MLIIDANVLIRAVLGIRVRTLITKYSAAVEFFAPDTAWAEAREHLPEILAKRRIPVDAALSLLNSLEEIIQLVDIETYGSFEQAARMRLSGRDLDDWPVLAAALALRCAIWTEDNNFFGAGVATWTTNRVELFLNSADRPDAVAD
jgi:predicted nucleic acid-binding protein